MKDAHGSKDLEEKVLNIQIHIQPIKKRQNCNAQLQHILYLLDIYSDKNMQKLKCTKINVVIGCKSGNLSLLYSILWGHKM